MKQGLVALAAIAIAMPSLPAHALAIEVEGGATDVCIVREEERPAPTPAAVKENAAGTMPKTGDSPIAAACAASAAAIAAAALLKGAERHDDR